MKKTAMQLLIEQWNKELKQPLGVLEDHRAYHTNDIKEAIRQAKELKKRIDQATELLETEREQSSQNIKLREAAEMVVKKSAWYDLEHISIDFANAVVELEKTLK